MSEAVRYAKRYWSFMVAERVGRPVLENSNPHRPGERAAAMDLNPPGASSEGSDETPRRGSRISAEEEERGEVTPISRSGTASGPEVQTRGERGVCRLTQHKNKAGDITSSLAYDDLTGMKLDAEKVV